MYAKVLLFSHELAKITLKTILISLDDDTKLEKINI